MTTRPHILVICGKNKRRSRTAEQIFKNDSRIHIRSAGLSPKSDRKISEKDITWANLIFVMEKDHKEKIIEIYRELELPEISVLYIPDEFEFMDEELIDKLTEGINYTLKEVFQL